MVNKTNPNGAGSLSSNLLPNFYRTPSNKKFLQATVDQLFQPGTVTKVNGYIGRKNSKATKGKDTFVDAPSNDRQNYQLEPGITVTDNLGNVTFFKDYIDYINQLNVFGSNTLNHSRLNKQEFYSWDPHIDWDKFIDFQNYYWLPYGPDTITIHGQQRAVVSTYTVKLEAEGADNQYVFTPNGFSRNPTLKLYRGQTYHFEIDSVGNPFSIKYERTPGKYNRYTNGVSGVAVEQGTITFTVPDESPNVLYYQSETDINAGGLIQIHDIKDNTYINVETDLLGKKTYKLSDGVALSNGMKVNFKGNVEPSTYAIGDYYVEGVGKSIKLVPQSMLEVIGEYTTAESIKFDSTPFDKEPFSDATGYAGVVDYIVINKASRDKNPWSRYNRWFHKDVITESAQYNGVIPTLDQTTRATRPIIEFNADLKLYNFGTTAGDDVDLIDSFTNDIFSIIEGSLGYSIDGVNLVDGHRILFTSDTDPLVNNKIYKVEFLEVAQQDASAKQIHLVEVSDPVLNQSILVRSGVSSQGKMYWYNGSDWKLAQQKTEINQNPMFDVVDSNGVSFSDLSVYLGSTFVGTKIFSYKVGIGASDIVLGFPLSYKNVNNIGDIVFNFNLVTDVFKYKKDKSLVDLSTNVGFLVSHDYAGNIVYENGWKTGSTNITQAAVRIYKDSLLVNNFPLDIFDNINDLDDLVVKVYVNGKRLNSNLWSLETRSDYKLLVLNSDISELDILTIKAFANQPINSNGFYEIPINLQNNPLNNIISDFTLGEVSDHVTTIVDNTPGFDGTFPGSNNLRDLGNVTSYGTKFVQHSGPASLAIYHVTNQENNVIKAIESARDDYNVFKRTFIDVAGNLGIESDPVSLVDLVLQKINKDKPNTAPYYFSDMIPYGASLKTDFIVEDYRIKTYSLSNVFSLSNLSNKAVGVYRNGVQLIYGKEYTFNSQGFVSLIIDVNNGDTITTYEYENTDGCFVPETPTKLGIWPKFEPKIYTDTTLITPRTMIQGHDGSLILAYGDQRDEIILELEKRIFNNIKTSYDTTIFDFDDVIPSYCRENDYSRDEYNKVLGPEFYKWVKLIGQDYFKPLTHDINNSFTYNYSNNEGPNGSPLPGYWRGVYRWVYDTDRPNLCPWEMLGFSIEPVWWQSVYGTAPYTSDNRVMWQDLADGLVKEPGKPFVKLPKYVRTYLMDCIPVNEYGDLLSPIESGAARGTITNNIDLPFVFGDIGPVEAAWRRSSHYSFSVLLASLKLTPAKTFGLLLDKSRITRNIANQIVYSETGLRIRPQDILVPSLYSSTTRIQSSGIINYITQLILNYIFSNNVENYNSYKDDLKALNSQLSYRVSSFTNKDQFNLLLDSKTPSSTGSVFIPNEDYSVILNSSSPVKKLTYSGVIITKLQTGYQVSGYSQTHPYFEAYSYLQSGMTINVGGISESFTKWTAGQQYHTGAIVLHNGKYYRSLRLNTSTTEFDSSAFAMLSELPVVGGASAIFRKTWDKETVITVPYGTEYSTKQQVVDFLLGYGEWLKSQGFSFNEFNNNLGMVSNWETSAKEFLFWTTQNWSTGEDKWEEWTPNKPYTYGTIVRYNGDYYSVKNNVEAQAIFDEDQFNKLEGLNNYGSSVISLSPCAGAITFSNSMSVVDDVDNPFNPYEIFKVDGTALHSIDLNSYRENNTVVYAPKTNDGIYSASFYLIQYEHVVILNNKTIFNDVIYNPESGYRQERIKVSGYVTNDWNGSLNIPGFIFDQAKVYPWKAWTDYNLGDIVTHQTYYYSANQALPGTSSFEPKNWSQLSKAPSQKILPNWTNAATQFADFYSLDVDSFDLQHQKVGQHLIGYQKREYLNNIIQDDVSEFKFYQGMIREKGTQNVLNKLFNVLGSENKETLQFYEEWALRVGQYGANTAFQQIEFVLNEGDVKNNPQGYVLLNRQSKDVNHFINQIIPKDVYVKPLGYSSTPWPIRTKFKPFLRSAGHVNARDVSLSLKQITDVTSVDPITLTDGNYISCSFDLTSWNVYRYTDLSDFVSVDSVTYNATPKEITINFNDNISIDVGTYIAITGTTDLNGFYCVTSNTSTSITFSKEYKGWVSPYSQLSSIKIAELTSQKLNSLDNVESIFPLAINTGELVWTNNSYTPTDGKWASWEYKPVYSSSNITKLVPTAGAEYGRSIAISNDGFSALASTTDGQTEVFYKPGIVPAWASLQLIQKPIISANYTTGTVTGIIDSFDVSGLSSGLTIQTRGSGYTPATGTVTYYNVPLSITPSDPSTVGAVVNVTVRNGVVYSISLISVTAQYISGAILQALSSNMGGTGSGFTVLVTNTAGNGYTPLTSVSTYYDVPLTGGNGTGATGDITIKNGKVLSVLLNRPGSGYRPGDSLSASESDIGETVSTPFSILVNGVNKNFDYNLATVLAISSDKQWIATGSPLAGYAATKFVGSWSSQNYTLGSIVSYNGKYYRAPNNINASYTSVTGSTLSVAQGARFTVVVTNNSYTVKVVSGGAGYKEGNRVKILGSAVGGIDTVNDIIITVGVTNQQSIVDGNITWTGTVPPRTYLTLPGEVILGTGAIFTVNPILTTVNGQTVKTYSIVPTNIGTGYITGDTVRISGSSIGGKDVLHDVVVTIPQLFSVNTSIHADSITGICAWTPISYIPADVSGTNSSYAAQGAISLYQKDSANNYILIDTIVSPSPAANERFGSSLSFDGSSLYVGATGNSSSTGKVYKLKYSSSSQAKSEYNPVGSSSNTIVLTSTAGIRPGMYIQGTGFSSGQYVLDVVSDTIITLSNGPDSTPDGILNFVITEWEYDTESYTGTQTGSLFGSSMQFSKDGTTLVIASSGGSHPGKVDIYKNDGTTFNHLQSIVGLDSTFASSISLSDNGTYLAINNDYSYYQPLSYSGVIGIYEYSNGEYIKDYDRSIGQDVVDAIGNTTGSFKFGSKISFMNDYKTLVVYNHNITIQGASTGFIDIYDRYVSKWVWSESLPITTETSDGYGTGFAVGNNQIFIGAPFAMDSDVITGKIYNYTKPLGSFSWQISESQTEVIDVSKIKKVFLYNKVTGKLLKYLDIIDPIQGKIAGPADEEINYKAFYDPATYSVGTSSVTVDASCSWNTRQIGQLWWDLRTAKFLDSYNEDLVFRNTTWNTLATGASIDIYEWVESTLKPSQWDSQADTVAGLTNGISGTSLYGDTVYSEKLYYDKISKTNKSKYYFWVKNKKVIPKITGRNMSASDVSSLISNPRGQAYSYIAFTGINTFSLVNVKSYLADADTVLSVEYWISDKTDQNIHSQYKIISNDPRTDLPNVIEQKWFDSLCGSDKNGLLVPDPTLPIKLRYGVENRPRQSMFVNRIEALKQFVESANSLLIVDQIVNNIDMSGLESYDKEPSVVKGLYDQVLDTELELPYSNYVGFTIPSLTPEVVDGKIVGITINNPGKGYLIAPYIQISGAGTGAVVKTTINTLGQITGVTILSQGEGYNSYTSCSIRNYSVLVHSDSQADGNWSIYSYDPNYKVWSRTLTKSYDVRDYWSYVDWYATGYNQFTSPEYAVDTFTDLNLILSEIGDTVKVRNANSGGWLLLEKYANSNSVDWTTSYNVVGIENGTIQLDKSLYEFSGTNVGYDSSIFDGESFDIVASVELRFIIETLKNEVLVNELKQDYLNLFFDSVRYAFSEQVYVDWIFKTSFVKAQHNVGSLDQPANYPVDNLSNFEDYVREVKPYRTEVREYVSNFDGLDTAQLPITDFDLQPIFEDGAINTIKVFEVDGQIITDNPAVSTYPWKFWLDNASYVVTELILTSGGQGYIREPHVVIKGNSGSGATAKAFFANGVVNRIVLLTKGSGYLSAPTVTLEGGLSETGISATAVAIIGNGVVRSTHAVVKFDRLTQTNYITQITQTETFTGTGSALQFPLVWNPEITVGKSSVTVNGIPVLREHYKLTAVTSKKKGFTTKSGLLTFVVGYAPAVNSQIIIDYNIAVDELNSSDRILYHYNPEEGQLGKSLSQLMTGIDYGGVIVNGLGFSILSGWDSVPYFKDKWDAYDTSFSDYYVTVAAGTHSFTLPYLPEVGTQINVYHIKNNVDSYASNGTDVEYTYNILANNPIATTVTSVTTSGISTAVLDGSYGTVLKVANTNGIQAGMAVAGTGFPRTRTVISVVDGNTVSLNAEPDSAPAGTLIFSYNYAGSDKLTVSSTDNLYVGDLIQAESSIFTYNTTVKEIVDDTTVTLSNILYLTIANGTEITSTRTLLQPNDITINANGTAVLTSPLPVNTVLNFTGKINPVRLDDENYGTDQQINDSAIMITPVANGSSSTFTIPGTFTVLNGDQFILRKSTSDGSILPSDADYDTSLVGGDIAYSTATGISADDILVDGDGFVTPTTSPAPEEVVPGQVVDSVAIKVFDRPSSASADIKVDNYIATGSQTEYKISQTLNSKTSVIVKITGTTSAIQTIDEDYVVDYSTSTIQLNSAPAAGNVVSIFSLGFNGSGILDLDYFVSDGTTIEFITKATWLDSVTSLVYVDGVAVTPELFKTDGTYAFANAVGFRFTSAPASGSLINFVIVSGAIQTFAVTNTEVISADGRSSNGTSTYTLQNKVGNALPYESNMIVRVNQTILKAPNTNYFVIGKNRLNYTIDNTKVLPYSATVDQINVLAAGNKLKLGVDYTLDLGGITIKLTKASYKTYAGKSLVISVTSEEGYYYNSDTQSITFNQAYTSNDYVEVISSFNHDVLDIQRTSITVSSQVSLTPNTIEYYTYKEITSGLIHLDRTVINDNYVWVIKNSTLLVPSIDYKLNDDRKTIQLLLELDLSDEVTLITFSSNVLTDGIAYMQFKDMLNRVHYKRLSSEKQTELAQDLHWNDTTITLLDASAFSEPNPSLNRPGVIEIQGERIEYFSKTGNVLSKLRRGTLGTGVSNVYVVGTYVQDIGPTETIPYVENSITEQVLSDGTETISLNFVPSSQDEIEVFVGGYDDSETWTASTTYEEGVIVHVGSYTYRCVTPHTSSSMFAEDYDKWNFFVGNIRLKKAAYSVHNVNIAPYSPEGDVTFPADFSVDGTSSSLTLTNLLSPGTQITVVKRTGTAWDSTVNILNDTSKIAEFLKAKPGIWYADFKK